jgi:hypothetical protein
MGAVTRVTLLREGPIAYRLWPGALATQSRVLANSTPSLSPWKEKTNRGNEREWWNYSRSGGLIDTGATTSARQAISLARPVDVEQSNAKAPAGATTGCA